jgi:hypothetical protein
MTIQVKEIASTYVLEDWTFVCQHESTHTESLDYGYPDAYLGDWVDDWRDTQVCDDCKEQLEEDF